jgi:ATP-dependent helicase/nuclease subunit A
MNDFGVLEDRDARDFALSAFGENIFIDAGAGTGKTRTLVDRIVNQIMNQPDFQITNLAAITFTEKAAAELRNRFRESFIKAKKQTKTANEMERIERALALLDSAAIGTIHSFCKRILSDNAIQAKLPVGFQIASESAGPMHRVNRARRVADRAWEELSDEKKGILLGVNFGANHMESIVAAIDEKFATVNEIDLENLGKNQAAQYQEVVFEFIRHSIGYLRVDLEQRRETGEIEFDDLLIMTRDLLLNEQDLAIRVGNEYKVMLVDEFQDTDPIQWEIIKLISIEPGNSSPRAGSLILVGDPKQSIYRFRNADIHTFLDAKANYSENEASGKFGKIVDLTTNFRSTKEILEFVNWLFADKSDDSSNPLNMGVTYKRLGVRHNPQSATAGPAVRVIKAPPAKVDKITQVEFDWTAKEIRKAIDEKYAITEEVGQGADKRREYRTEPAQFKDVCILIPVRGHVNDLLRALAKHDIPFRSADPRIVFARPLVMGLINALRVVAQTDDDMALWATLKSPLFAHTDEELFKYVDGPEVKANWSIDGGATGNDPAVLRSMEILFATRLSADVVSPHSVLNYLLSQKQIFEKLRFDKNGEFEASALRMLLAHSSQWENEGGHGLLEYLETLNVLIDDKSKSSLPLPDDMETNSVEIMTMHASKGLEFPITVVSGLSSIIGANYETLLISRAKEIEFYLGRDKNKNWLASEGYKDLKETEVAEEERLELNRLLYVGVTRAQDHLILSAVASPGESRARSNALISRLEELENEPELPFEWANYGVEKDTDSEYTDERLNIETLEFDTDFSREIAASKQKRVITPSSKGPVSMKILSSANQAPLDEQSAGEDYIEDDVESGAQAKKARQLAAGGEFGTAVHQVMEKIIKLGRIPDEELLEGFIWAEGLEASGRLRSSINAILKTDLLKEALASNERYPELHLALVDPNDEVKMVEGFADLVYKSEEGHVLVDYKTDSPDSLKTRMLHYMDQLGKYSIVLEKLTGEKPVHVYILHVHTDSKTGATSARSLPLYF